MTNEVRTKMCRMLCNKRELAPDGKLMPKVYVVNDRPYWFLNVAKRAAYGTDYPIEVIGIEEAFEWHTGLNRSALPKHEVNWQFDQKGATYDGRLFDEGISITAESAKVRIITEG